MKIGEAKAPPTKGGQAPPKAGKHLSKEDG